METLIKQFIFVASGDCIGVELYKTGETVDSYLFVTIYTCPSVLENLWRQFLIVESIIIGAECQIAPIIMNATVCVSSVGSIVDTSALLHMQSLLRGLACSTCLWWCSVHCFLCQSDVSEPGMAMNGLISVPAESSTKLPTEVSDELASIQDAGTEFSF